VRAGDRDRRLQARQFAEQVGAVQLGRAPLGVGGRDRGRVDHLGAGGHVGGVVTDRGLDPRRAQRRCERRARGAIGARDARAECAGDDGEPAHSGAADPHEMQSSS